MLKYWIIVLGLTASTVAVTCVVFEAYTATRGARCVESWKNRRDAVYSWQTGCLVSLGDGTWVPEANVVVLTR